MARLSKRISEALIAAGARLKRDKKHRVYALPNGQTFVVAQTPSDVRAEENALSELKARTGVKPARRKASPEVREERRQRPGRNGSAPSRLGPLSPLSAALMTSGVVEAQLRERIAVLEDTCLLRECEIAGLRKRLADVESLRVVRAWRWLSDLLARMGQ